MKKCQKRQKNICRGSDNKGRDAVNQKKNIKRLHEITRTLSGKNSNPSRPVKDEKGNIQSGEEAQRARWAEHFKETLNRPAPPAPPDIPPQSELLDVNTTITTAVTRVRPCTGKPLFSAISITKSWAEKIPARPGPR